MRDALINKPHWDLREGEASSAFELFSFSTAMTGLLRSILGRNKFLLCSSKCPISFFQKKNPIFLSMCTMPWENLASSKIGGWEFSFRRCLRTDFCRFSLFLFQLLLFFFSYLRLYFLQTIYLFTNNLENFHQCYIHWTLLYIIVRLWWFGILIQLEDPWLWGGVPAI